MERNITKALRFKELAYLYVNTVCPYLVNNSYKNRDKDNSVSTARLIKVFNNTIDKVDLEAVEPEKVFRKVVGYKLALEDKYPMTPDKSYVYDQEMDDFYVKMLSSYLDLLSPSTGPYDTDLINKVVELKARAKAYYISGVTAEALLESVASTGKINKNKCLDNLTEDDKDRRAIRWDELTTKKSFVYGEATDDDYLKLANDYLDTVLPCLALFYTKDLDKSQLEEEAAIEVCSGKAYVLNEVLNNKIKGLDILETAVRFKVNEEKKYLEANNTTWTQGPDDLEVFHINILSRAISMIDKSESEKMSYMKENAELYSMGYSAEAIFESFAGQPLNESKRVQDVSIDDMLSRRRTFDYVKKAQ